MPRYTEEEINIIIDGYNDPNILIREIAANLNRETSLIAIKAKKLGLTKTMKHHADDGYQCTHCGYKLIENVNWAPWAYNRGTYKCMTCVRKDVKNKAREVREIVLSRFGGKCEICGYVGYALQIDHIHNDGAKERKKLKTMNKYYKHLLSLSDEELKQNYQLLCANCNWEKREGTILGTHRKYKI